MTPPTTRACDTPHCRATTILDIARHFEDYEIVTFNAFGGNGRLMRVTCELVSGAIDVVINPELDQVIFDRAYNNHKVTGYSLDLGYRDSSESRLKHKNTGFVTKYFSEVAPQHLAGCNLLRTN